MVLNLNTMLWCTAVPSYMWCGTHVLPHTCSVVLSFKYSVLLITLHVCTVHVYSMIY